MHEWFWGNVGRTEKTRLKRNAGGNVRKLPMMVPLPSSDNSIGTHFVQNQSASPAFLIRHLPADKRKFCKGLHHRCLRSNATFPPGEGIRSIVQSAFFDTLKHPLRVERVLVYDRNVGYISAKTLPCFYETIRYLWVRAENYSNIASTVFASASILTVKGSSLLCR